MSEIQDTENKYFDTGETLKRKKRIKIIFFSAIAVIVLVAVFVVYQVMRIRQSKVLEEQEKKTIDMQIKMKEEQIANIKKQAELERVNLTKTESQKKQEILNNIRKNFENETGIRE
jgi:flagellar biosynthesis/type III secretory pathway M-ring protein FliF/YscJ